MRVREAVTKDRIDILSLPQDASLYSAQGRLFLVNLIQKILTAQVSLQDTKHPVIIVVTGKTTMESDLVKDQPWITIYEGFQDVFSLLSQLTSLTYPYVYFIGTGDCVGSWTELFYALNRRVFVTSNAKFGWDTGNSFIPQIILQKRFYNSLQWLEAQPFIHKIESVSRLSSSWVIDGIIDPHVHTDDMIMTICEYLEETSSRQDKTKPNIKLPLLDEKISWGKAHELFHVWSKIWEIHDLNTPGQLKKCYQHLQESKWVQTPLEQQALYHYLASRTWMRFYRRLFHEPSVKKRPEINSLPLIYLHIDGIGELSPAIDIFGILLQKAKGIIFCDHDLERLSLTQLLIFKKLSKLEGEKKISDLWSAKVFHLNTWPVEKKTSLYFNSRGLVEVKANSSTYTYKIITPPIQEKRKERTLEPFFSFLEDKGPLYPLLAHECLPEKNKKFITFPISVWMQLLFLEEILFLKFHLKLSFEDTLLQIQKAGWGITTSLSYWQSLLQFETGPFHLDPENPQNWSLYPKRLQKSTSWKALITDIPLNRAKLTIYLSQSLTVDIHLKAFSWVLSEYLVHSKVLACLEDAEQYTVTNLAMPRGLRPSHIMEVWTRGRLKHYLQHHWPNVSDLPHA